MYLKRLLGNSLEPLRRLFCHPPVIFIMRIPTTLIYIAFYLGVAVAAPIPDDGGTRVAIAIKRTTEVV